VPHPPTGIPSRHVRISRDARDPSRLQPPHPLNARAIHTGRYARSRRTTGQQISCAESAFGACCPSVASLAWSLAGAGMPGSAGVFRVLARLSGIGGEGFSWMGGGQQCGDRTAARLDPVLPAALFAHDPAAFGVDGPAGLGVDDCMLAFCGGKLASAG
jgi:hypothetical protein